MEDLVSQNKSCRVRMWALRKNAHSRARSAIGEKNVLAKEGKSMRRGNGVPRRRSEKIGGKSTGPKRPNGPVNMDIESVAGAIEHSVGVVFPPKPKEPEPNIRRQVEEALAYIHSKGRVYGRGQAATN